MNKVNFSNIFSFQKKSRVKAGEGLSEGLYPFFTSSNIQSKYINEYTFQNPSLIFGTGGQASIHYCDNKFNVSTDCLVAQLKENVKYSVRFIYYYLNGNIHLLEREFKGAGLKHISKSAIEKINIPVPPFTEQKRIVNILDKADALRQKNKQLIAAYDELLQSTFLDMFGDPVTNPKGWEKLELIILASKNSRYSLSSGPFGSSLTSKDYVDVGVPILRGTNVTSGKLDMTNVKYITEEKAQELKRSEVKPFDIVMIAVGSSGKTLMIPTKLKRAIMSQNFNKITVDTNLIKPIFMEYALNDMDIQLQIKRKMSDTVRTFFSLTNMKELKVICPPISLQCKFEQIVENIEAQKTILKQSIRESEDLFIGLVQKAFKGELTGKR